MLIITIFTIFWPRRDNRRSTRQVFVKLSGKLGSLQIVNSNGQVAFSVITIIMVMMIRMTRFIVTLTKVLTSLANFWQVVTNQAGEVGPCSAWLTWEHIDHQLCNNKTNVINIFHQVCGKKISPGLWQ